MVLEGSDCLHVISDCFDSFFEIFLKVPPPGNLQSWVKYYGKYESFGKEFQWTKFNAERVINYDSNLLICGTFLIKLIPHTNNCESQKRPTIWTWEQFLWTFGHFASQQRFFVLKNCTILVCFHPLPPTPIFGTKELYNHGFWDSKFPFCSD